MSTPPFWPQVLSRLLFPKYQHYNGCWINAFQCISIAIVMRAPDEKEQPLEQPDISIWWRGSPEVKANTLMGSRKIICKCKDSHLAGWVGHQDDPASGHVLLHGAPEGIVKSSLYVGVKWRHIKNIRYLKVLASGWKSCIFKFYHLRACWASLVSLSTSVSTTTLDREVKTQ